MPGTRTLFAGISKLPAASLLVADADGRVEITSFREAPGEPFTDRADEDLADELAQRFTDAVERQMMSDVPTAPSSAAASTRPPSPRP